MATANLCENKLTFCDTMIKTEDLCPFAVTCIEVTCGVVVTFAVVITCAVVVTCAVAVTCAVVVTCWKLLVLL